MEKQFVELSEQLAKNGFKVKTFKNLAEAKKELLNQIKEEDSIGIGGSITIDELDIYDDLKNRGNEVYWHWRQDVEDAAKKAINTDVYLTSTNALTMDGKLINMDGNGNRVASMIYGHRDVYVVTGKNKICKNYEEAIERIRNIVAPMNAKRLKLDTPCAHTGVCSDCDSKQRICRAEVVLHKNPNTTNIIIYLIDENLGY